MITWIMIIVAALVFALGLLLVYMGYLIKVKRMTNLIAGYDPKKVTDEEGLANWVGGKVILVGAITCIYAPVYAVPALGNLPLASLAVHLGYALIVLVLAIRTAIGSARY